MKNEPFTPPPNPWIQITWQNDRVELVVLPLFLWGMGLFDADKESLGWALAFWAIGFAIWCLWTMWRVTDRLPADDTWRAVATLVYGGAPWLILLPASAFVPSWLLLPLAFPLVFVPGVWSLVAARRKNLPPMPHGRRALMLWGASLLSVVWTAIFAALIWPNAKDHTQPPALILWVAAPMIPLDLFLAVRLAVSATRGFTRGRPLTAESLLAEQPLTGASP